MKEVIVYSTPGCPHCKKVKDFFKEKNISYKDINVAENEDSADMIAEKTGQIGVPVTKIGEEYIVGDDINKIMKLLK